MPEELTVREAAERHGVTASWLIRNLDQIRHRQIGPMYLLDAESVAVWAANRKRRGGSQKGVPWSKKKVGQPVQTIEVTSSPDRSAIAGDTQPPAPQETVIDTPEGVHIRIEALRPAGERWLEAEATQGDMRATIYLRPYGTMASVWTLSKSYDRAESSAPGKMGRKQEQRGQTLLVLLDKHMHEAMVAAGWQAEERAGNEVWRYQPSLLTPGGPVN